MKIYQLYIRINFSNPTKQLYKRNNITIIMSNIIFLHKKHIEYYYSN